MDLRVDQVVQLLGPVGVDVRKDCVLLEGAVAIAHREETAAEVVVGFTEIGFQSNRLSKRLDCVVQAIQLEQRLAHVVRRVCVARFQRRELAEDLDGFVKFLRTQIPRAESFVSNGVIGSQANRSLVRLDLVISLAPVAIDESERVIRIGGVVRIEFDRLDRKSVV